MSFRMRPSSQGWHLRIAANNLYRAGRITESEDAKRDLFTFLNKDSENSSRNQGLSAPTPDWYYPPAKDPRDGSAIPTLNSHSWNIGVPGAKKARVSSFES